MSLTFLKGGVQRFVCLDEQEAVGSDYRDGQVLVDLTRLDVENHLVHVRAQFIREQLKKMRRRNGDSAFLFENLQTRS